MDYNNDLEFYKIIEKLKEYALTEKARERLNMVPVMDEKELKNRLAETTEARECIEKNGVPPITAAKDIQKITEASIRGEMLSVEEIDMIRQFCVSSMRLKRYLLRSGDMGLSIASYGSGINDLELIKEEIERCIRNGKVDDYATKELKDIRKKLENITVNIRTKLENILKSKKECFSDSFVSNRNGHFTLPVKKEYKLQISGSVIDTSSSGATYFIEPTIVSKLKADYDNLQIEEKNEERKILYTLSSLISEFSNEIALNLGYIEELDYIFAKGKLSIDMKGIPANINTDRYVKIKNGRHPLLNQSACVPLNIEFGKEIRGIVITGPNTGGKTVALKTVGLLSVMTQCGLHIPCEEADICMNSSVLCDIGDGQSITENLSTFSAHIKNVIQIISHVDPDSLVLMDELGSGTDPSEGMGIAIAILEELKLSQCNFIATTHYPEVKEYAQNTEGLINAKMAFDKVSLKPLYELEMGLAGESCALYIAKQLGMPKKMLMRAYEETYHKTHNISPESMNKEIFEDAKDIEKNISNLSIHKQDTPKQINNRASKFEIGDSVMVYPQKKLGIVFQRADAKGEVGVQIQNKKILVNHKRLQLKVAAAELYPEDYDFSIVFDSVQTRKARKVMGKRHEEGLEIKIE